MNMRFLFIIAHDAGFAPDDQLMGDIANWIADTSAQGSRCHGNPLRPVSDAVTVRVRDGKALLSPGPFSDAGEQMCAYELVECADLDAAVQLATGHPMAAAATIEVRPIWAELATNIN
jgi:hypothetical protein